VPMRIVVSPPRSIARTSPTSVMIPVNIAR
jgi:hypothetical protein